jgi:VIT1/CCC1 family predicted Fe2+/Mn2+ transporter
VLCTALALGGIEIGMAAHGRSRHPERHLADRSGWIRAAVLGSGDAIVSNAALMIGVASSNASKGSILLAGIAGLVAGAMSMGVGEYVSVSSQLDAQRADIEREKRELEEEPHAELAELAAIYRKRGLEKDLAWKVAEALSAHDKLGAHVRDELGIVEAARARPLQAAWVSASSFGSFALVPIAALLAAPAPWRAATIAIVSLAALAFLGALGGHLGGAPRARAAVRVTVGGGLAMGLTALVGHFFGAS